MPRLVRLIAPLLRGLRRRIIAGRRAKLDALPEASGRVVFLGDSITEGGIWDGWFPELKTRNAGIGWDSISGVAGRLDSALQDPSAVCLMIGTNDLSGYGESYAVQDIADQTDALLAQIRSMAPTARLVVTGVMPRAKAYAAEIKRLNALVEGHVAKHGGVFVDPWPALSGPDGALRREFTRDRLHLNPAGYKAWTDLLRPHLGDL